MDDFQRDLDENLAAIRAHRDALLAAVAHLDPADLAATRRGGWSIRDTLRHVIDSEVAYAKVVAFLCGKPSDAVNATDEDVESPQAAVQALHRVRQQFLPLLDGIDETTFYDLRALGKERYSVVSVLENVAMHDEEHLGQITKTLAANPG